MHRDLHPEVVLLLGKIAKLVALIDPRLHVVGASLAGGARGVDRSCDERTMHSGTARQCGRLQRAVHRC